MLKCYLFKKIFNIKIKCNKGVPPLLHDNDMPHSCGHPNEWSHITIAAITTPRLSLRYPHSLSGRQRRRCIAPLFFYHSNRVGPFIPKRGFPSNKIVSTHKCLALYRITVIFRIPEALILSIVPTSLISVTTLIDELPQLQ